MQEQAPNEPVSERALPPFARGSRAILFVQAEWTESEHGSTVCMRTAGPESPLRSVGALVSSLPVLLPATLAIIISLPLTFLETLLSSAPAVLLVLFVLVALSVINVLQNGIASRPPPLLTSVEDVRKLRTKVTSRRHPIAAHPPTHLKSVDR